MKKLYRIKETELINDITTYDNFGGIVYKLHYGEPPEIETFTLTDFDEVYSTKLINAYKDVTLFGNKLYIAFYDICGQYNKVFEKDFESYTYCTSIVEPSQSYSLSELMSELCADEFIDYCKDSGLNVCPVMR